MGQNKRKSRPAPSCGKKDSRQQTLEKVEKDALKRSVQLLSTCLKARATDSCSSAVLNREVQGALMGVVLDHTTQADEATAAAAPSSKHSGDNHNELCEICERGGDLLCCDTCTLVFHWDTCLRPKLTAIPKGKWSCSYCIVEVKILKYIRVSVYLKFVRLSAFVGHSFRRF